MKGLFVHNVCEPGHSQPFSKATFSVTGRSSRLLTALVSIMLLSLCLCLMLLSMFNFVFTHTSRAAFWSLLLLTFARLSRIMISLSSGRYFLCGLHTSKTMC